MHNTSNRSVQYLTKSCGGSDVRSNRCIAKKYPIRSNIWHISGEKRYHSTVTAHVTVLTASPDGAQEGTRGLGLFLVRQRLDDGTRNEMGIVRLQDKLGTRSPATAEVSLGAAHTEAMGPIESRFTNMIRIVRQMSRLCNCVFACGAVRRAILTADRYATHRSALGRKLNDVPSIRESLGTINAKAVAMLSRAFALVRILVEIESSTSSSVVAIIYRVLSNTSKHCRSILVRELVIAAGNYLRGNGIGNDVSIMWRMLCDSLVYEKWERPHNGLIAQGVCDFKRSGALLLEVSARIPASFKPVEAKKRSAHVHSILSLLEQLGNRLRDILNSNEHPTLNVWIAFSTSGDVFFLSEMSREANAYQRSSVGGEKSKSARVSSDNVSPRSRIGIGYRVLSIVR